MPRIECCYYPGVTLVIGRGTELAEDHGDDVIPWVGWMHHLQSPTFFGFYG